MPHSTFLIPLLSDAPDPAQKPPATFLRRILLRIEQYIASMLVPEPSESEQQQPLIEKQGTLHSCDARVGNRGLTSDLVELDALLVTRSDSGTAPC